MTDPIEGLVLSRLLCERESVGLAKVRTSLEPLVRHRWSAAEWRQVFTTTIERLVSSSSLEVSPRGSTRLTRSGREDAIAFLEVSKARVPTQWRAVRNVLAAKAVGAVGTATSAEALRCAIVAQAYGIELKGRPSEAALRNALTWKALGVTSDRPATRGAIQATLLGRLVGDEGGVDPKRAVSVLAAKAMGARRTGAEELKVSAIRSLLERTASTEPLPAREPERAEPPSEASADLSAFAERILAIARDTRPDGRFGSNKVFISHIWRTLEQDGEKDREDFARRLIEANRLGHLRLSRADLVEAMDRTELAASEIAHENSTFHFVRI